MGASLGSPNFGKLPGGPIGDFIGFGGDLLRDILQITLNPKP